MARFPASQNGSSPTCPTTDHRSARPLSSAFSTYGSSFSYIAATTTLTNPQGVGFISNAVPLAQVGIVATGIVNVVVGFLVLDGIGDTINGLFGGVAGTNYGENNSLMVITRNYSGPALIAAGAIAILLGFIGKLAGLVNTIPLAVTGGLSIYLFGVIGMQGIALMIAEKVNLYDPRQLAIGATILVVGIGGHIGFNGNLPIAILPGIFPNGLPAIATSAVLGILLNLIFVLFRAPELPGGETDA